MAFIDEVSLLVESGAGGNGCISFRREKYVPRGGPNGGNGGRGGNVIFRASRDKHSLLDFKYRPRFQAERGEHGMGKEKDGRSGTDLVIAVPCGTLVYDEETGLLLGDLTQDGDELLIAEGGRGGRGNKTFATSTNRAPRMATPGKPGTVRKVRLELRLIADVGLVGLPNAGKSSFLRSISRAQPKVASYPFTTLEPSLGVVEHKSVGFVVADLPGLIEGASEGAGLGHKFLRHVTRNRILLHLVSLEESPEQIRAAVDAIREELRCFDASLQDREERLVFTKADLLDAATLEERLGALRDLGLEGVAISSHTHFGVESLLDTVAARLVALRNEVSAPTEAVEFDTAPPPERSTVLGVPLSGASGERPGSAV
jgi:GTP-binding protein